MDAKNLTNLKAVRERIPAPVEWPLSSDYGVGHEAPRRAAYEGFRLPPRAREETRRPRPKAIGSARGAREILRPRASPRPRPRHGETRRGERGPKPCRLSEASRTCVHVRWCPGMPPQAACGHGQVAFRRTGSLLGPVSGA
jgi:hypothetical protein